MITIRILLIRHGETIWTGKEKRYLGQTDIPLCENGRRQIQNLGETMQEIPGTIVTSSSIRCLESGQILQKLWGCSLHSCDELREIHLGEWEGQPMSQIRAQYPEEFKKRGANLADYRIPGGETFRQVQERACKKLAELAQETTEDLAVVTHAGVIRTVLCAVNDIPLEQLFSYSVSYGEVIVLQEKEIQKLKTLFIE